MLTAAVPAKAKRRPRIRREVRWTIWAVLLIFIFEYLLIPELASARKSVKLLGEVNVWLLVLAVILEGCALAAYAQLT